MPGLGISEHPSASRPLPPGRGAGRKLSRLLCLGADSPVCWCLRGGRGSRPLQLGSDRQRPMYSPPGERSRQLGTRAKSTSTGERPYKGPLNWFPERCCRMEGLELAASPSFLQTTCGEEGGAAVRGRPTPSRPWGPVGTDCPVTQDRLCPPELWGQEGAQRRPSGPVCACPPSPPHSPPRHRSHRCGPGLTVVQWGLPPRGGGGCRQRRGTQDTLPRVGPGHSPRDPPSLLAPSRSTGTARTDQADGRRTLCLPKAPEGPSFSKPRHPQAGGCCRAERVPRAPTV